MIKFVGNIVTVDGKSFEVDYPVADAFKHEETIVVLFEPNAYASKFGQFENLVAFSSEGKELWKAELPTSSSSDRYYRIASREPLRAYSASSFECEIDLLSGRIARRSFVK